MSCCGTTGARLHDRPVDQVPFLQRLAEVKQLRTVRWATAPAFAIFHEGSSLAYLILAWWGNDNDLFTSVSARTASGWVEDAAAYSFCVYDLEIFWHERNYFVEHVFCAAPSLANYRARRFRNR